MRRRRAYESDASHDAKGLKLAKGKIGSPDVEVLLKWNKVAERVRQLIRTDDFLSPEELEKYEVDLQIEYGDLSLPKDTPHDQYREEDGEVSYRISASEKNAGKKISVINEEGDVKVRYR